LPVFPEAHISQSEATIPASFTAKLVHMALNPYSGLSLTHTWPGRCLKNQSAYLGYTFSIFLRGLKGKNAFTYP